MSRRLPIFMTIGVVLWTIVPGTRSVTCASAEPPLTTEQARRQSRETQEEIRRTKSRISENRQQISRGVAELSKLEADIADCRRTVDDMAVQVRELDGKISGLGKQISASEKKLQRMRDEYAKAVRKMRLAKGRHSRLAFIFSAKTFNQAVRRLRYLREFSDWQQNQTRLIHAQMDRLREQTQQLSATRRDKDKALATSRRAKVRLDESRRQQQELVTELRRHGDELQAHLAQKQQEADMLRNRISSLIAAEQARKQEAAKARIAEQARIAAEKKRQAKAKAEAERQAQAKAKAEAERQAQAKAKAEAEKRQTARKNPAKETKKQSSQQPKQQQQTAQQPPRRRKKDMPKQQAATPANPPEPEQTKVPSRQGSGSDYAKARGRKPRTEAAKAATREAGAAAKQATAASGFEQMRGRLPRPVSGSFRILSPFGRHALPDLPSVTYDNPGIDAETSDGAHAKAVYDGKVSGVYVLPGYNNVVIVNHGTYYTVYGNIDSPAVSNGQTVKAGQNLGKLARDPDRNGKTMIHFEVWRNREKLNPAEWIH